MTSAPPSRPVLQPPMRPLPSSTVLLLRDRPSGLEIMMVRRSRSAVFGGMFVFPGGVVDPVDRSPLAAEATVAGSGDDFAWRAAGLRETAEEVGIYLTDRPVPPPERPLQGAAVYRWVLSHEARFDAGRLRYLSNWITPRPAPQRYDARFYLARVEGDEPVDLADGELTEMAWTRPAEALHRFRTGEWDMILPTERNLETLVGLADARQAWESAKDIVGMQPILPKMVIRNGRLEALLPGEPGYEEAE